MDVNTLFGVKDKVVLVTGGSRGIGLMIAEGFVANGARVYVSSRSKDVCDTVSTELTAKGPGKCFSLPADLQKMSDIEDLVSRLTELEPAGVDVLVNNAGANWASPIDSYPVNGFNKVMNLNLTNIFFLSQKMLPLLLKKASHDDPSRIINIGSVDGISVSKFETYAYGASKAGLHHLTRGMSTHLGFRNITANAVAPGPFMSKMMAETLAKNKDSIVSGNPMRRIGNPDDMAGVCIYLSSKAGAYTNGAVIVVDGGSSIAPKL
ncbi:Rhamnolipids biosynthesis 3-oxoacyl-[acyl-carrier-protein] reductase [Smittium culicis]|uniref:Rhamnolipids biosynthesis 3-oxoacyl-[acyl-carrier-protein] reductase n=1 Tax=Smittium culicis TaxID=133412 RepID=A0A1R1X9R5_9FUNG|nr:Rhamnolipids biosynthesis 3-oxoacyl-[acyl-carrier-protein] reductase [Smittium culicis]